MATIIAKYIFSSEPEYYSAIERIRNAGVGNEGSDWECGDRTIWIYDNHKNGALVGQICRALGGTPSQ